MTAPGGTAPGRGKTPAERLVTIDGAPIPDLAEWARRPLRNTEELRPGVVPDVHDRQRNRIELEAAPVVDVRDVFDRATRRLMSGPEVE